MTGYQRPRANPRLVRDEARRLIDYAAQDHNRGYSPQERDMATYLLAEWIGVALRMVRGFRLSEVPPVLPDITLMITRNRQGDAKT